jgi:hypothetical protein
MKTKEYLKNGGLSDVVKFVSGNSIEVGRELSVLDKFAVDFTAILKKYTEYVIVSGYVSIVLGRSRASEDIDVIIPRIDFETFLKLYEELKKAHFYCINALLPEDIFEYLSEKTSVRFAKESTVIPNMEVKFAKNRIDELTLNNTLRVKLGKNELIVSHLEMQIAFKESVLKSPKDLEDARHIRNIAEGYFDEELIEKYKCELNEIYS